MVTKGGPPFAYEIFPGNIFERHTLVPIIKKFINKQKVKECAIVADAVMISTDNIKVLVENDVNYSVGTTMDNLPECSLVK